MKFEKEEENRNTKKVERLYITANEEYVLHEFHMKKAVNGIVGRIIKVNK